LLWENERGVLGPVRTRTKNGNLTLSKRPQSNNKNKNKNNNSQKDIAKETDSGYTTATTNIALHGGMQEGEKRQRDREARKRVNNNSINKRNGCNVN
jgi:hypothetical protein